MENIEKYSKENIEKYSRQLDIINEKQMEVPIHVIGCGGIGSWATLMLAKMGCSNVTIYDFDKVEYHNTASQFFEERQIGELKTEALRSNVYCQTNINVEIGDVKDEKKITTEKGLADGIIVIAVDSMEIRWELMEFFKNSACLVIDARMGGLQAEVYASTGLTYKDTLVEVGEVQHETCTAKAISFNCALIASLIANYVRLHVNNQLTLPTERMFLFDPVMMIMPKPVAEALEE